jgi:hypothetical protein
LPDWLSDALCRAATGDGWVDRSLYTDADLAVLQFQRVLGLTSIDPGALRGDLADRLVMVDLERIAPEARRSKRELDAAFELARPRLVGAVLDLVVEVLRRRGVHLQKSLPRMADYAAVLAAQDEARGSDGLARYVAQERRVAEDVVEADVVAAAISTWARGRESWSGTAKQLLDEIRQSTPPRGWPPNPRALAGQLRRAAPALAQLGVIVEAPKPNARPRLWRVIVSSLDPPDGRPPDDPDGLDGRMPSLVSRNKLSTGDRVSDSPGAPAQPATGRAEASFDGSDQQPVPTVGIVGPPPTTQNRALDDVSDQWVAPTVGRSSAGTRGATDGTEACGWVDSDGLDEADGRLRPTDAGSENSSATVAAAPCCHAPAPVDAERKRGVRVQLALGSPPVITAGTDRPTLEQPEARLTPERAEAALRHVIIGGLPNSDVAEAFANVEQLRDRARAEQIAAAARGEREQRRG